MNDEAKHIAISIKAQSIVDDVLERNDQDYQYALRELAYLQAKVELEKRNG